MNSSIKQRHMAWSDIVLPEEQLTDLKKQAAMFLSNHPARPQGTLLKGAPGTGKTLLARTLATAMGLNFIKVTLADLKIPSLGASGQKVRELWAEARVGRPTILFVDECESIFGKRSSVDTDIVAADLTQAFLGEWNAKEDGVWLIGATNRREMIDEAILSRFGAEIEIALPNEQARRSILRKELTAASFWGEIPQDFCSLTQGMSGRDLSQLAARIMRNAYPDQPGRENFMAMLDTMRRMSNTTVDRAARWDTLVLDPATLTKLKTTCSLLKEAEGWRASGVTIPRGLLLCGQPGTGKTQIARTIANESGLSFLGVTTSDMKANYVGQSGNKVKNLFERARSQAPSILFIDELDIVAPSRGSAQHDALTAEIVGQLLQEMDGIRCEANVVFVLAATNHELMIDTAILSRIEQRVAIPMPDKSARIRLLEVMLKGKKIGFPLEAGVNFLVRFSDNMSGRDIRNWIARAEQSAIARAIMLGGPERFLLDLGDFGDYATTREEAREKQAICAA